MGCVTIDHAVSSISIAAAAADDDELAPPGGEIQGPSISRVLG